MTEHDTELLSQYLDSELSAEEATALEQRLVAEPALRQRWQRFKHSDQQLRAHCRAPGTDRVPPHVAALLSEHQADNRPTNNVLPLPRRHPARAGAGLAIAASLVAAAGLVLAPQWRDAASPRHPAAANQPGIARALDHIPSSLDQWHEVDNSSQLRPVLSFAGTNGQWCREYLLKQNGAQWRGVACRESGSWNTAIVVADRSHTATGANYQPAGAGDVDAISSYVDNHSSDIPLSLDQEAALIARRWQ